MFLNPIPVKIPSVTPHSNDLVTLGIATVASGTLWSHNPQKWNQSHWLQEDKRSWGTSRGPNRWHFIKDVFKQAFARILNALHAKARRLQMKTVIALERERINLYNKEPHDIADTPVRTTRAAHSSASLGSSEKGRCPDIPRHTRAPPACRDPEGKRGHLNS